MSISNKIKKKWVIFCKMIYFLFKNWKHSNIQWLFFTNKEKNTKLKQCYYYDLHIYLFLTLIESGTLPFLLTAKFLIFSFFITKIIIKKLNLYISLFDEISKFRWKSLIKSGSKPKRENESKDSHWLYWIFSFSKNKDYDQIKTVVLNENNVVTLNINITKVNLFQRFQLQYWPTLIPNGKLQFNFWIKLY